MKNKSLTDDLNRIMLVLAMVIGAVFAFFCVQNIFEAVHIKNTTATIVEVFDEYTFPNEPDTVHYSMYIEFTVDAQGYRKTFSVPSDVPLKNGDTLEISYDDREPEKFAAPLSAFRNNILVSALAAAVCIYCLVSNKKYFKDYYTDFILKHKKAVIFTLADVAAAVIIGVITRIRSSDPDLVGFEGLGIGIIGLALVALCTFALIVVWIAAVVKSSKKYNNEMLAAQGEYNGGTL